jgi:hypothetical protein
MIRVCNFSMDGVEVKIASMSVAEAEIFVKESGDLIARAKQGSVANEEWMQRRNKTIIAALAKAGEEWTEEKLKSELDIPTLDALYLKILEFSGLRSGEVAAAASPSPKSAAA